MTVPTITCPRCRRRSTNPGDILNRYCGNCHAFHDDMTAATEVPAGPERSAWLEAEFPKRWRMVSVVADRITPALADLDLPSILSTDTVPKKVRELLMSGEGLSLRRGEMFYGPDGDPMDLPLGAVLEMINRVRTVGGGELDAFLWTDDGVPVNVRTTYLGIDLSTSGPLPLIWETLVIVGDDLSIGVLEPIRYATRAAAYAGNARVTEVVMESMREAAS